MIMAEVELRRHNWLTDVERTSTGIMHLLPGELACTAPVVIPIAAANVHAVHRRWIDSKVSERLITNSAPWNRIVVVGGGDGTTWLDGWVDDKPGHWSRCLPLINHRHVPGWLTRLHATRSSPLKLALARHRLSPVWFLMAGGRHGLQSVDVPDCSNVRLYSLQSLSPLDKNDWEKYSWNVNLNALCLANRVAMLLTNIRMICDMVLALIAVAIWSLELTLLRRAGRSTV